MIEAVWDQGFKRSYRKRIHRHPHLKKQFREQLNRFLEEPFDPLLRDDDSHLWGRGLTLVGDCFYR